MPEMYINSAFPSHAVCLPNFLSRTVRVSPRRIVWAGSAAAVRSSNLYAYSIAVLHGKCLQSVLLKNALLLVECHASAFCFLMSWCARSCFCLVLVRVWVCFDMLPWGVCTGLVKGFEALEGTSALCFQALMCSDVLLPCVWKGLEVFCCVSALCFERFWYVRRCFRLVPLKVSKRSEVLLH